MTISVVKVVSAGGATQYVGPLTINDGLPLELTLFRRIAAVSAGYTENQPTFSPQ